MSIRAEVEATAKPRLSPYQGLVPYGQADAEWFFGRDNSREIVLDSLRAYRVSVLYGESGVGKSSLLSASVLAHLRQQSRTNLAAPEGEAILAVVFANWTDRDPLAALKAAVRDSAGELSPELLVPAPEGTLAEVLAFWFQRLPGGTFVILDQLEELFLYHGSDAAGRAFEDELVGAIRRRDGANFLLSIREDALAKLDRLQGRVPTLLDNLVRLEHLSEQAAREAIECPLERWSSVQGEQVTIEPALVEQLLTQVEAGKMLIPSAVGAGQVNQTSGEPRIEAPYLQLVLARIWFEERAADSSVLRLQTLERLGGAERIVRAHLDDVLDTLSWKDRDTASVVLRHLVTPSGAKIAHRSSDLVAYTGAPLERVERVLTTLAGEPRILRPVADGSYEIYHDVLAAAVLDWRQRYEKRRRALLARTAAVLAAAAIAALVAYLGQVLGGLEGRTVDARFSIRGDERPPSNIVVVGIDNRTLNQLGGSGAPAAGGLTWPYPRRVEGELINRINAQHPAVIAFDIAFSTVSSLNDEVPFVNAISNSNGRIVFSTTAPEAHGDSLFLGHSADQLIHEGLNMRIGNGNFELDPGGVIRRMVYRLGGLDTFAVVSAEVAAHRKVPRGSFQGQSVYIDYLGPANTFHYVSYVTALQGKLPKNYFRSKIVVIGGVAPILGDIHATSTDGLMPGPEVQANAIETVLRGLPLRGAPGWLNLVLVAMLGLLVPLASLRVGSTVIPAITLTAGGLYLLAAQIAFNHDLVVPVVNPLLALVLSTAAVLGWRLRTATARL